MTRQLDPEYPGKFSSSLVAGLAMLACFSPERPVRGIADMADQLDLGRSTTHRYATTLVTLGYLDQGPSRKYRLSPRVADVGLSLLDSMAVRCVAREYLRQLRAQTGHTVRLGVLDQGEIVYVDCWQGCRQGQYAIDVGIGQGTRLPVHCTAAGKALLACLPVAEQRGVIAKQRLKRCGPKTITRKTALHVELERITAGEHLAVEDEELLVGRRALAVNALEGDGRPVAAVELAVPATRCPHKELVVTFGPMILIAAERISLALQQQRSGNLSRVATNESGGDL